MIRHLLYLTDLSNREDVQGNLLNTEFSSFVGMYPIVQRYG